MTKSDVLKIIGSREINQFSIEADIVCDRLAILTSDGILDDFATKLTLQKYLDELLDEGLIEKHVTGSVEYYRKPTNSP